MTPRNSNNTAPCTNGTTSTCVTWAGNNIPELGILTGMTMTMVEYKIACKLVDVLKDLDFSTLDLSCLIDKQPVASEDKNINLIIKLLLDNQCTLKQLIDAATGNTNTTVTINVNMKCLKKFDDFGNEIPQDLNAALQSLINQTCQDVTDIAILKATTQDLQTQIDNIPPVVPYTEPSISTCITPTPRPTSQTVPLVAQDYCNYKDKVGAEVDIQQAIARQPAGLNTLLGTIEGWILNPQSLAQSENNMWLLSSNLLSRIKNIEDNCCKITCKDIKIALQITSNSDGDAINVKFSESLGTDIPNGFTDCGSTLTILDKNGNFLEYPIAITQNGTTGPFSFAGLDASGPMTASVTGRLCSESFQCEKCVAKVFVPNAGCPVCLVTGTGTSGVVTIVYQTPGSTVVQTLIVVPNSVAYIPKNAIIIGVDRTGSADAQSDCIDLNAPPYVCVRIDYALSGSTPHAVTWQQINNDVLPVGIGYSTVEYPLSGIQDGNPDQLAKAISAAVPIGLIKVVGGSTIGSIGTRYQERIVLKVPQTLVSSLYIEYKVADYAPVKVFAVRCDECCPSTSEDNS